MSSVPKDISALAYEIFFTVGGYNITKGHFIKLFFILSCPSTGTNKDALVAPDRFIQQKWALVQTGWFKIHMLLTSYLCLIDYKFWREWADVTGSETWGRTKWEQREPMQYQKEWQWPKNIKQYCCGGGTLLLKITQPRKWGTANTHPVVCYVEDFVLYNF